MITLTDDERRALELIREHRRIYRATLEAEHDSPEWHRMRKKLAANFDERTRHIYDKTRNVDPKYDRLFTTHEEYGYTIRSWNMDLLDDKGEDDE